MSSDITRSEEMSPARLASLSDEELLERVQRQTFRFFWEAGHPVSGLVPDRRPAGKGQSADLAATGGCGFAIMALVVAVEHRWITREQALERLGAMLDVLVRATCYHGALPHFLDGRTGATLPFSRKDDGGDLVETSFLCMGLLTARQYFGRDAPLERRVRQLMTWVWEEVEWDWYTRGGRGVLYWHWSSNNGWALEHEIRGWNECLLTYVLAAGAPRYPIDAQVYHRGFAAGRDFLNGRSWGGIELPLGPAYGGPLFFAHYSFCGLDPRGLEDRYASYWEQNLRHVRINHAHCVANPNHHRAYGEHCWGLTASDDPDGYAVHAPDSDNGTIAPTAALASFPYAPAQAMQALRHFLGTFGERVWRPHGFVDAFCPQRDWYADTHLAIDQGPIILMIENFRSGLLWKLFMSAPEVRTGLRRLGFSSPHLPG
ncbi:MAG TPA: glucoamylase family protein [Steroidobacteraceae bacterium]|nr:glucoamylase family protein [Steroidobacteraceae bacterium]